jgi:hypothetical protein
MFGKNTTLIINLRQATGWKKLGYFRGGCGKNNNWRKTQLYNIMKKPTQFLLANACSKISKIIYNNE